MRSADVRFWGNSGHRANLRECRLMTKADTDESLRPAEIAQPSPNFAVGWVHVLLLGSRGILDEPDMLTPDMKRIIEEQRLGFVATASLDGTPNVSPKGTFAVLDDRTIAFGEIRSPGTIRNLKANPRIEVNFVDAFVRKGYRFTGMATVVERGEPAFDTLLPNLRSALAHRIRAIVTIAVTKALPLTSPAYDEGKTEAELRRAWTTRFRVLQPFERFEE